MENLQARWRDYWYVFPAMATQKAGVHDPNVLLALLQKM